MIQDKQKKFKIIYKKDHRIKLINGKIMDVVKQETLGLSSQKEKL